VAKAPEVVVAENRGSVISTGNGETIRADFIPSLAEAATSSLPAGHPAHKAAVAPPPETPAVESAPAVEETEFSEAFIDIADGKPLISKPKA